VICCTADRDRLVAHFLQGNITHGTLLQASDILPFEQGVRALGAELIEVKRPFPYDLKQLLDDHARQVSWHHFCTLNAHVFIFIACLFRWRMRTVPRLCDSPLRAVAAVLTSAVRPQQRVRQVLFLPTAATNEDHACSLNCRELMSPEHGACVHAATRRCRELAGNATPLPMQQWWMQ
jgi:hypothetical protein